MSEVGFQPLSRVVGEWDEGLAMICPSALDVAADNVVTAGETMFSYQSSGDLGGSVTLFAGSLFIVAENLVDDRLERVELPADRFPGTSVRFGLGFAKHLANFSTGVVESPCNLTDRHPVAMGSANLAVIGHLEHPCSPVAVSLQILQSEGSGGSRLLADSLPSPGSLLLADYHPYKPASTLLSLAILFLSVTESTGRILSSVSDQSSSDRSS